GGIPKYAVVSLGLSERWEAEDVESLYEGMNRCAETFGCSIVGGDTVRSKGGCFLSVAVVGEVEETCLVRRGGASERDLLCVTGVLGGARVGLDVLASGAMRSDFQDAVARFLEPRPRVKEVRQLVKELSVSSMIDISDGLSSEAHHLCESSGLGCLMDEDQIPVSEDAIRWVEYKGGDPMAYALESGEEYELLFTVDRASYERWDRKASAEGRPDVFVIGEMTRKENGIRMRKGGKTKTLSRKGWDHFGS
ncbi:MAG: thiamine-phosphate kinase, partial [bacterium]